MGVTGWNAVMRMLPGSKIKNGIQICIRNLTMSKAAWEELKPILAVHGATVDGKKATTSVAKPKPPRKKPEPTPTEVLKKKQSARDKSNPNKQSAREMVSVSSKTKT